MFSECGGWNCLNSGDMASKRGEKMKKFLKTLTSLLAGQYNDESVILP
jgi:hypothetical protein